MTTHRSILAGPGARAVRAIAFATAIAAAAAAMPLCADRSAAQDETLSDGRAADQAEAASPLPPRPAVAVTEVAFQGYLTTPSGAPITGSVSIVATLYDAAAGGTSLWSETHPAITVTSGVFQLALGSVTPLEIPDFSGAPVYLGIAVNGEAELPRTRLLASPFAIRAAEADHALTADIASDGVWTVSGSDVYRLNGNVGVGTVPARKLDVSGTTAQVRFTSNVDANATVGSGILSLVNTTGTSGMQLDQNEIQVVGDQLYLNNDNQTATHINNTMHFINTTSRIGVNTTNPDARLAIENQGGADGLPLLSMSENEDAEFLFESGFAGTGSTGNALRLKTFWGEYPMTWRGDGNVGIGTTNPAHGLHVLKATGGGLASVAVRAEHTGASGIALDVRATSTDAAAVVEQFGAGDIVRGFNGGGSPVFRVTQTGQVVTPVLQITGGADLVESFDTHDERCEAGTVLVIDAAHPGALVASSHAYDAKVAGVVSGANGVRPGIQMGQTGLLDGATPVAMAGRVYVKCSSENGAIAPGDLLTTSSLLGHAMRATDSGRSNGAVLGKAMSALEAGTGLVLVLVNLQ